MKRLSILLGLLVIFSTLAAASVTVSDITIEPSQTIWRNEDFQIDATCSPTGDKHSVYIQNISHDGLSRQSQDSLQMTAESGSNDYFIDGEEVRDFWNDLEEFSAGEYSFFVGCSNETTDFESSKFSVKVLKIELKDGLGNDVYYTEQDIQVLFNVLEDIGATDVDIGEAVDFTASMDGKTQDLIEGYNSDKNHWAVSLAMPSEGGSYEANITAKYNGTSASLSRDIEVEEALQFDATVSDREIFGGETVDLEIKAVHLGEGLEVGKNDITLELDGDALTNVTEESVSPGTSTFSVFLPNKSRGEYDLKVDFSSGDLQASDTVKIGYPVRVKGEFRDADDNAVQFTLHFKRDGKTVKSIESRGEYSSSIVPGEYQVKLSFPDSVFSAEISLSDVEVDKWNDPVTYRLYRPPGGVPGLILGGLYAFRTALEPGSRSFRLGYSTEDIDDPRDMQVFHCDGWNIETRNCYGDWENVGSDFEIVGKKAEIDGGGDGAYAIGVRERLEVRHSLEEDTYTPDETIEVKGTVQGIRGGKVGNASVRVVDGSRTIGSTSTADNGVFELTVPVPQVAGSHRFDIRASKEPYGDGSSSFEVEVERPRRLKIISPGEIRVSPGDFRNVSLYVSNTGFRTIEEFSLVSDSVQFFGGASYDDSPLRVNQTRKVTLVLDVPPDAGEKTYTAEPVFTYDGQSVSRVFGVTVEASTDEETETSTGRLVSSDEDTAFPVPDLDFLSSGDIFEGLPVKSTIFLVIAAQVVLIAVVLVRRRGMPERERLTRTVSQIKEEMGGGLEPPEPVNTPPPRDAEGVERERVMRTFSHIKSQLSRGDD